MAGKGGKSAIGNVLEYESLIRLARSSASRGSFLDARSACEHALKIRKNAPEAMMLLAQLDWEQVQRPQAIDRMKKYIRLFPQDTRAMEMVGDWLRVEGHAPESVAYYEKSLRLRPGNPFAIAGLARTYMVLNENDKAAELLKSNIDSPQEHFMAARVYVALQLNLKNFSEAIRVASRHAHNPDAPGDARSEMYLILGQSYEKTGEYDKAFEAYRAANSIDVPPFDPRELEQFVRSSMNVFTKQNIAKFPRATETDSSQAIIVICRPRSGSTMLERIIASHPDTATTGENDFLRDIASNLSLSCGTTLAYPEAVADLDRNDVNMLSQRCLDVLRSASATATKLINKYVGNWRFTGLVQLLLPDAHVIDLERNAIDNGLAWYASALGKHHAYSYDLRHIGLQYRAQQALMNHFKEVLDIPILTVNYEDIVADQEHWTRTILEFCGLGFHEDALRFHEAGEKRQKTVAAGLSYNQVRQPMYKTSVGRAEKFGDHLAPLYEGLEEGRKLWGLPE